ncbi:MAG: adenosylcobinamide-GDP ribazoletransferase [Rhodobacteraceae bacterium]|nr:adenosylcobinamide-GDP ribazoletransferase [Paracoccaceae bacterium]
MNDLFQRHDIAAAFTLLTRLPVPADHEAAAQRSAHAVWAWPLVGAALGAMAALAASIMLALGTAPGIAAAIALASLALATGALHEDGLADCADGLAGGHDRDRRLAIMRDSRIGAFGAVALGLALLARWSGIETLASEGHLFWPLVAIGAMSRLPMALALFTLPPARTDGLAAGVGLPPPQAIAAASAIALAFALIAFGWGAIALVFWCLAATLPLFLTARRLIGGQTGDILGGSQQLAEIAGLAVATALIAA